MRVSTLASSALLFCLTTAFGPLDCGEGGEVSVSNVDPRTAPLQQEKHIQIHGSNFDQDSDYVVYFGALRSPRVVVLDENTLDVTTPRTDDAQTVSIVVRPDVGPAYRIHDAFTFLDAGGNVMEHLGDGENTDEDSNLAY